MPTLILPVSGFTGTSSWQQHINRGTPSTEPGTDFYVPRGTPVVAPADGEIWGYGLDIDQPAGRWVGINFANGMSFRCMHHAELRKTGGRVFQGDLLALSGSSGYGSEYFGEPYRNSAFWDNTGGDHTHATLWPDWNHRYGYRSPGVPFTIDLMQYVDGGFAGGSSTPFEEDDMFTDADRNLLQDVKNKLSIPDADYGRPEVIQQRTDAIRGKLESGAGYDWLPAIVNQNHGIVEMLKELDPSKSSDIAAFEVKLRESETRTIAATAKAIQDSTAMLRAEIVAGLSGVDGVDPAVIIAAVDKALDRVFVRPV